MNNTFSFEDITDVFDEKSDPLTSIGDFDLISSQNIAEIEENEWREVQDVEQIPFEYKERPTHNKNYSKLNIASAISFFFTDNLYTMAINTLIKT